MYVRCHVPLRPKAITPRRIALRLAGLWFLVLAAIVAALCIGAQDYPLSVFWQVVAGFDAGDPAHAIMVEMRLPRALAAVLVGAALAVAGLMMQALARNPLADPGLTGVNAGAALAVVAGLWLSGPQTPAGTALLALGGATLAALVVRALAGPGDSTLRLPLAGAAFSSLCMAVVAFVVLLNPEARNVYRFWMVGSLAAADGAGLARLAPVALAGVVLAALVARQVEALMLGSDLGAALGLNAGRVTGLALASIAVSAGAAVAIAGPVGFVGLIAPHLARRVAAGAGLTATLVLACPLGALLTLLADIVGRRLARPSELPLGIVLAMVGAPVFMLLVRRILRGAP